MMDDVRVKAARALCGFLAALDTVLGGTAFFAPGPFMRVFAPGLDAADLSLVRRTGALWLFFVPVQAWAAASGDPRAFRAVAVLRLQEVGADTTWAIAGHHLGRLGRPGVASAPPFNLAAGLLLLRAAGTLERSR